MVLQGFLRDQIEAGFPFFSPALPSKYADGAIHVVHLVLPGIHEAGIDPISDAFPDR